MLTDAQIQRAMRRGKGQLSDGKGRGTGRLVIIIRGTSAEWYAQQWLNGKKRLRKIGRYPAMSLAVARERFEAEFSQTIATRLDIRIATDAKPGTLSDLFNAYTDSLKLAGKRGEKDARYVLKRVLHQVDGKMLAKDVTAAHLVPVLRSFHKRGKSRMAAKLREYLSAAFTWGLKSENDYRTDQPKVFNLVSNPCRDIPVANKVAGSRYLNEDELRELWVWLGNRPTQPAIVAKLLILTGQRVEMFCELHSSQVDGDCVYWHRTKTGVPHLLPLPAQAVELLGTMKPNEHGWYFPSEAYPDKPMRSFRVWNEVVKFREGRPHFNPRDIRRTWKTLAGKAGLTKVERDLIQCHARSDVSARHYDRYEYLPEKRAAMKRWSEWFRSEIETAPP